MYILNNLNFENISLAISLITAGITTYIAVQQKDINKYKLKNDIFERRIKVYEATYNVLSVLGVTSELKYEVYSEFVNAKNIAPFIFSNNISAKLNEYFEVVFLKWHFSNFEEGILTEVFNEEIQDILDMHIGEKLISKMELMSKIHIYSLKEFKNINKLFEKDMRIYKY